MKPVLSNTPGVSDVIQWTEAIWVAVEENVRAQKIGSRRVTALITGLDGEYVILQVRNAETLTVKPGVRHEELRSGDDILRKRSAIGHSQIIRPAAPPLSFGEKLAAKATPQRLLIVLAVVALFTIPPVMQQLTGVSELSMLQKKAEQGDVEAQDQLAWTYLTSPGIKRRYVKAAKWYGEAAEHGYAPSEYHLGTLVVEGHPGVPRDTTGAAKLWRASAQQGDQEAEVALAQLYLEGKGVEKNPEEAYFWSVVAARAGDDASDSFRDHIAAQLKPDQVADVQRRASAWKPSQDPVTPESRDPIKPPSAP